jgi:hypothetical protein
MSDGHAERWLRPRYIFALVVLLVLGALIFTPAGDVSAYSAAVTSYSAQAFGARGVYEVGERLGWRVERRATPFDSVTDPRATYLILDPPSRLSATEVGNLLHAIRAGATALVVPTPDSPLGDSLGVHRSGMSAFGMTIVGHPDSTVERRTAAMAIARSAGELGRFDYALATDSTMKWSATTLVRVRNDSAEQAAVMSLSIGSGEIVAISDVNFLRNINARGGAGSVLAVRIFEWLDPDRSAPLVFDEYHQGFGVRHSMPGAIGGALLRTAPGRAFLQLVVAGLILLLVYGVRPIAPLRRRSMERRSPLEHVGALARAYQQAEATRLATQRLLRGLRRRRPLGATGALDDESYLSLISSRKPELAEDVDRVRTALAKPLPAAEWVAVGSAIDHIERIIAQ